MEILLNWLWQGAVVALVTMAALGALRRVKAATRYAICWAAIGAVLMLPLVAGAQGLVAPGTAGDLGGSWPAPWISVPHAWWTSGRVALAVWSVWALAHSWRFAASVAGLRRAARRCHPFPSALELELACWTTVKPQGRAARLALSDRVRAAAVFGGRSPVIAVAPALVRHLTADELDAIVIHEWAHVQRRDDVANVVQMIVSSIAGWHPAVWWLDRRLRIERETACDETAIAMTRAPKAYATSLVKLAGLPRVTREPLPALGALSSRTLTTRVRRIVSRRGFAPPGWSRTLAATGIAAVAASSLAIASMSLVEVAVASAEVDHARTEVATAPAMAPVTPSSDTTSPAPVDAPASGGPVETRPPAPTRAVAGLPRLPGRVELKPATSPAATSTRTSGATGPDARVVDATHQAPTPAPPRPAGQPHDNTAPPAVTSTGLAAPANQAAPSTPWDAAAGAGVAVGQGSKTAGLATAAFFSRLGKQIGRSF